MRHTNIHKKYIIDALKYKGEVVAMTGDGVNDAPALKRADVAVAMGKRGTGVAKEAADLVLSEDDFGAFYTAIKYGRMAYLILRSFIRFLMSCNWDELALITFWTFSGFPVPLITAQILWINIATDGPPAIALADDRPDEDIVMTKKPRNPKWSVLRGMMTFMVVATILQFSVSSIGFLLGEPLTNVLTARTMCFLGAVVFELAIIWNIRSEHRSFYRMYKDGDIFKNKWFVIATVACTILSLALPYIPIVGPGIGIVPLTPIQFAIPVGLGFFFGLVFMQPQWWMGKKFLKWE